MNTYQYVLCTVKSNICIHISKFKNTFSNYIVFFLIFPPRIFSWMMGTTPRFGITKCRSYKYCFPCGSRTHGMQRSSRSLSHCTKRVKVFTTVAFWKLLLLRNWSYLNVQTGISLEDHFWLFSSVYMLLLVTIPRCHCRRYLPLRAALAEGSL